MKLFWLVFLLVVVGNVIYVVVLMGMVVVMEYVIVVIENFMDGNCIFLILLIVGVFVFWGVGIFMS